MRCHTHLSSTFSQRFSTSSFCIAASQPDSSWYEGEVSYGPRMVNTASPPLTYAPPPERTGWPSREPGLEVYFAHATAAKCRTKSRAFEPKHNHASPAHGTTLPCSSHLTSRRMLCLQHSMPERCYCNTATASPSKSGSELSVLNGAPEWTYLFLC